MEANYLKKAGQKSNLNNVDSPLLISPLVNNKRKNPFARSESFPQKIEAISVATSGNKQLTISQLIDENNTSEDSDSSTNVDFVKPVAKLMKKTTSSNNLTSFRSTLNDTIAEIKPIIKQEASKLPPVVEGNRFSYQYDGLGGRKKIFLSGSTSSLASLGSSSASSLNKNSKLQKFSRSKVT